MAEHVGIRRFQTFLREIRELLEDDGLFYMQVAGLRATWQYEDFIWYVIFCIYLHVKVTSKI
jgi:cyclopropane fatty-acyl-phospholipid synthase-like methyltransferase